MSSFGRSHATCSIIVVFLSLGIFLCVVSDIGYSCHGLRRLLRPPLEIARWFHRIGSRKRDDALSALPRNQRHHLAILERTSLPLSLSLSSPPGSFSPRLPTTAKSKSGRILELPFPAFPRSLARSSAFPSLLRRTACSSPALCPRFSSTPCRPIARWRSKPTWRRSTSSSAASAADLSSRRTVEPRGCCEIDVILQAAWRDDAFVTLVDNSNRILNLRLDASAGKTCIQVLVGHEVAVLERFER